MRKIEAQMNAAIAGRRNWAKDNTRVEVNKHGDTFVTCTVTTSLPSPMKVISDSLHVDGRQSPLI